MEALTNLLMYHYHASRRMLAYTFSQTPFSINSKILHLRLSVINFSILYFLWVADKSQRSICLEHWHKRSIWFHSKIYINLNSNWVEILYSTQSSARCICIYARFVFTRKRRFISGFPFDHKTNREKWI